MFCRGHLLWLSDVATSLLWMLHGLLSTLEMSEFVVVHLHSVSTTASVEGIRLDPAPHDNISPVLCARLLGTLLTNEPTYPMHLPERKLQPRHSLHTKYWKKRLTARPPVRF